MKKMSVLPVAIAAVLLSANALAVDLNKVSHTAVYNSSNMTIGTDTLGGVTYSTVSYEGLINGGAPGMPSLPIDYIRFSVPYNATNFTVTTTERGLMDQNLNYLVYPCQRPWLTDGPVPPIALPDTSAYYSGSSYPSQMAWVADEGYLAGENHIVTVAVMPFRYSHSTTADVLTKITRCSVTLHFQLSDSLPMSPIVRNDSLLREEGYELTQSMVVNPNQVKSFAPVNSANPGIGDIGVIQGGIGGNELNGGGIVPPQPIDSLLPPPGVDTTGIGTELVLEYSNYYPYLIVTTSELKHAARRIAALKRQKGYNVNVVSMDQVLSSVFSEQGDVVGVGSNAHLSYTDDAGKLRQFIRNYYKFFGTKYVLLVGDLPYRLIDGEGGVPILTDSYFSDLTASWQDTLTTDSYPELYVGRITANHFGSNHIEQINNYTDKALRYELNPGNGDYSYLKKAFFCQGKEFKGSFPEVENTLSQIYPDQLRYHEPYINNSLHPNGKDIIDTLNANPVGFMSIFNHGDTTRVRVYGKDLNNNMFFIYAKRSYDDGDGLNCLHNKYYPMIYYSPACVTIPFDKKKKLTFGESFITGKDYGGPVYIGYTRSSHTESGKAQANAFSQRVKDGYVKLSVALSLSKLDAVLEKICNEFILCYFGDPELELWTDLPSTYSNIAIQRTDNEITVSGIDVNSTIIAYNCRNNMNKQKIVTTPNISLNDASPNSPIMLYKHNYLPYIAPLLLQNERFNYSKYIIANDVLAGSTIDPNRTSGDVVVKAGIEYEIEASGTVTLENGFKVERGATFAVYPSSF